MVDIWANKLQELSSSTGQVKVLNSLVPAAVTVTFSATPTFDATKGNAFQITLTGNVTSSTLSNAVAGQFLFFTVTQDGTGSHTFAWPSNFQNAPTVVSTASKSTNVVGFYDGTNFNIAGQWNTATGGTGTGTVTSVGMTGDGVVYKSSVGGSPVTTSGTLVPALASANAGYVLAGPIGSTQSNVSYRQSKVAVSSGTTGTVTFDSPIQSGSAIVVVPLATSSGGWYFTAISDTLSTSYTGYGGAAATFRAIGFAASSGTCTITVSGGSTVSGVPILAIEIPGAATYVDGSSWASSSWNTGGAVPFTITSSSVTPTNATDSFIVIQTSNGTCYPSSGFTTNPVASLASTVDSGSAETGAIWLYAPGNTGSFAFSVTMATHTGSCHNSGTTYVLCFTQSASASAAPWVARRLQETDLPATSISAIQSVTKYAIASTVSLPSNTNTTVISQSVTMPSSGGPFRVLASYSGVEAVGGSGTVTSWISDGTNDGATMQADTTDATAMPINCEGWFGPYSNNQSVTFTWKVNPGTYATGTYQMNTGFAASTSGESGHMTLTVLQSRN